MKRVPVLATLLVVAAVAVMVSLGLWQLQRAQWKDGLLAKLEGASALASVPFPVSADDQWQLPLFRRSALTCGKIVGKRSVAGQNRAGETGYVHILDCESGGHPQPVAVEIGWSRDPNQRFEWSGGAVSGVIAPDRNRGVRLVAAAAPAGLQPSAPPSAEAIPNNHRSYAIQWFAFAAIALVIFALALRGRQRS